MDREVIIKLVRDDQKTFTIGTYQNWRLLKKKGLDGFGDFDADINYVDNAQADGGMITSTRLGKVDRTIKFAYINPSMNDIARKTASAFFNSKSMYKVYVTYGGRTRWAEGYILKCAIGTASDIRDLLEIQVTFLFANPYWKSYDNFGKDIAEVRGLVAFPYLVSSNVAPVGFTGGKYNFAKKVDLSNDGDVETYCTAIFTANGAVSNPSLIINDDYVRVIDELVSGDVITMDFTATPPTVKKNGVNYIGHCDRTSSFDAMILGIGDTEVEFDADNGSDLLSVSIYYNKLYCSV